MARAGFNPLRAVFFTVTATTCCAPPIDEPPPPPPHTLVIDGLFVDPPQPVTGQGALLTVLVRDNLDHDVVVNWTAAAGGVSVMGFGAVWTAPAVPGAYRLDVSVVDVVDASSVTMALFVPVLPAPPLDPGDTPPVIESITTSEDFLVANQLSTLCVVATDADGDPLTYIWTSPPGDVTDDAACIDYLAFEGACLPGYYAFSVRVEDGRGGSAEASLAIWIDPFMS